MFDMLSSTNWDNFVLDRTALEEFWENNGIDMNTFDLVEYELVLEEL